MVGELTVAALAELLDKTDAPAAAALAALLHAVDDEWVVVYAHLRGEGYSGRRFCCLLLPEFVERAFHNPSWDLGPGHGGPGFVGYGGEEGLTYEYVRVGDDGPVPLVHHRLFNDGSPDVIELAEDFRLLWCLREDRERGEFWTTNDTGDGVVVARWLDDELLVQRSYLRRYQAARQLTLALFVEVTRSEDESMPTVENHNVDVTDGQYRLTYYTGQFSRLPFTRLSGKRLLPPPPIDTYGKWPYEPEPSYVEFIIGTDEVGREILHTCDPHKLANYFGANPDSPHYLTPVFFRREVLRKYWDDPRYNVQDGYIAAEHLWGLRVDNNTSDNVMVFLGDLGRDLRYAEQAYWRSFNVVGGQMSETNFRRSVLGQWADPDRIEFRFRHAFGELKEAWMSRFGWPLYLELHDDDRHNLKGLHVPTTEGFAEFDDELQSLAKVVVDSLNQGGMVTATLTRAGTAGGINRLEQQLAEISYPRATDLLSVLRDIQGARSRSAAHRKGSDFDRDVLRGEAGSLRDLFEAYLERLRDAMADLAEFCKTGSS
jgi:hypothetical protein